MEKKQVQEAISRVDTLLGKARFTEPLLNREDHIVLVNDIKLIQQCCVQYFTHTETAKVDLEKKDGRANIIPISPATGDKNLEGSGDGI